MITVSSDTQSGEPPPLPAETVTSLTTAALTENGTDTGRVQVVFTDDEDLRQLKNRFFGQDHYTDVIAFNLNDPSEPLDGEIYISTERALENSKLYNEPYPRELMRLVIHGCLHLLGIKDDTPEEQAKMRAREDHFLAQTPDTQNHERDTR
ncbi:MAG: rRNA maturation RNase YbeY [Fidelibacterota bacterium]|nr:MAG: rRNA maturation RNase YbeY [Candidatus Neomarinimicrobiota bacterium]